VKLQETQTEMATKLANAERELAQLRTTSRSAEFELVGKQQVRLAPQC
jgi:ribosomal protein L29